MILKLRLNPDLLVINRKTDSIWDWLGDLGGFFDSLSLIGEVLVNPYAIYALRKHLAWLFVRIQTSND